MKQLGRTFGKIADLSGLFSGWLVPAMGLLILTETISRYALRHPLMVSDEFSAYMLVALAFLGAAYTWQQKAHVRITALVRRLPAKAASWLRLVTLVLAFLFTLGLLQASYGFMVTSFRLHAASATWLHFPLQGIQILVPIGFAFLAIVVLLDIAKAIKDIRAGKNVEDATV